jgi:glutamate/tyrosine decarboxylase-like PLP-dependent enzyme
MTTSERDACPENAVDGARDLDAEQTTGFTDMDPEAFRHVLPALAGDDGALDAHNAAIMDAVNRSGEAFLSHTKVRGRFTIRLAVANLRTEIHHVERAWQLLQAAAEEVEPR